ncbi:MAG: hypothetical protein HYS39_02195, partial [Proteobacteria bacterium]|nr:hypothetical protein [Pseudomonadota bacterium]
MKDFLSYTHKEGKTIVSAIDQCADLKDVLASFPSSFIICDEYFSSLFSSYSPILFVKSSEKLKSWTSIKKICNTLLANNISKKTYLIGIGGGVIGDVVGFCSSILMRGIPWIFVPTTLLAQSDSCLGGKTAINTEFGKNLIGRIHHPQRIFLHTFFLSTLSKRHLLSGYIEILKHALICDRAFFDELTTYLPDFLQNPSHYPHLAQKSLQLKAQIINNDWEETHHHRMKLNLGHTFGHALEIYSEYDL